MINLGISIVATKSYCYALAPQARRIQSAVKYAGLEEGHIIIVTDRDNSLTKIESLYKELLPKWKFHLLKLDLEDGHKNYKTAAQLYIATGRTVAFSKARELNVDYLYSLDSDILPGINSIQCSLDILSFDKGYYSIACPLYASQGGGSFLCGHGSPERPIFPDFSEDERKVPQRYLQFKAKYRKKLEKLKIKNQKSNDSYESIIRKLVWVDKRIEKYPPKANIFILNGKKWKRRGWFDFAYPAIGKGSIVPTDWCGFGATMMNKVALDLAIFDGYDGKGTEDLYVCFNRWYPAGLRIAAIPHSLCDHIIRDRKNPNKKIHMQAYHEENGEFKNHLRQRARPFFTLEEGEKFEVDKSGNVTEIKPKTSKN